MAISHISLEGVIFVVCLTAFLVPFLTITRLWILRHRNKSPARIASDVFAVIFMGTILTNGGLLLSNLVIELLIRKHEAGGKDQAILMAILNVFKGNPQDGIIDEAKWDRAVQYLQRNFGSSTVYTVQLWVLKGAFISLYYDLVPQLSVKVRWVLYLTTAYTAASLVAALAIQFTYCPKVTNNWNPLQYCTYVTSLTWINSVSWINITTDLLILVIPLFVINSLKLGGRERYALAFIFGLGFMSIASSIVRFVLLHSLAAAAAPDIDLIHSAILWGSLECNMAYAAFCLPAFRVLIRRDNDQKTMQSMINSRNGGTLTSRTGLVPRKPSPHIRSSLTSEDHGNGGNYNEEVKGIEQGAIVVRNSLSVTSNTESDAEMRPWEGRWDTSNNGHISHYGGR